jgi:hypothetical protein
MNLFLPVGIDYPGVEWVGVARPTQGVFELPLASRAPYGYDPVPTITRSPYLKFSVSWGVTSYTSRITSIGRYEYYYQNFQRIAVADGLVRVLLLGSNGEVICQAEAPFDRNALKADLVFENIAYSAQNALLEYEFISQSSRPFGDCSLATPVARYPILLSEPNQALIAKTVSSGGTIVGYGPEVTARALVNLTEAEIINLRAEAAIVGSNFANVETDPKLNCRSAITAVATSSANLLGPVDLQAVNNAAGTTKAAVTASVAMTASAQAAATMRAIPYVGTTIFLSSQATATATTKPTQNLLVSSRVSGMTIYVSLDTREFVTSPVLAIPITKMYFTRRDIEAVDVKFVRGGETVPLSYGAEGQLGIKSEFDGAALALDGSWSEKGNDTNITYQFSLNLNTSEIDDLFVTDNEESVMAKLELTWTEGGTINTTLPCVAVILNDVLRGTEGAPTLATASSFNISDGTGGVWNVTVDANGILTTQKV